MKKKWLWCSLVPLAAVPFLTTTTGCSSSSSSGPPNTGVVQGAVDTHCGGTIVTVQPAVCHATPPPAGDAGADGGSAASGSAGGSDFGATMFGAEGDDDDCKYHLVWSADDVKQGQDVRFTVAVTEKNDSQPVRGVPIRIEAFLDSTHPAPNTKPDQTSSETSTDGTYTIGPIRFDASGQWTVRFHLHEECNDSTESPHGHAAFFVHVP